MVTAHSLLWGDVAEHVTLLLIASSHALWTRSVLLGYTIPEFFSSLLENDKLFILLITLSAQCIKLKMRRICHTFLQCKATLGFMLEVKNADENHKVNT
jgi:hypothetical protein